MSTPYQGAATQTNIGEAKIRGERNENDKLKEIQIKSEINGNGELEDIEMTNI